MSNCTCSTCQQTTTHGIFKATLFLDTGLELNIEASITPTNGQFITEKIIDMWLAPFGLGRENVEAIDMDWNGVHCPICDVTTIEPDDEPIIKTETHDIIQAGTNPVPDWMPLDALV